MLHGETLVWCNKMLSWSSKITSFVQQNPENEQILNNILAEKINEVTDSFGGLSNIIQLCLTNPNASKYIDSNKFSTFEAIMIQNGISCENINNHPASLIYVDGDTDVETPKSPTMDHHDHDMNMNARQLRVASIDSIDSRNVNPFDFTQKSINTKSTYNHNQAINIINVKNAKEFDKSRLIINVEAKDSIVFQWFGIDGYIQKIISSEHFFHSLLVVAIIELIIAFTFLMIDGPNMIYYAILSAAFCLGIIIHIMVLLNSHKLLYRLIFNTFDFWFILWNTINFIVSRIVLGFDPYIWHSIIWSTEVALGATMFACLDAANVSKCTEVTCRTIALTYLTFLGILFYFSGKDVEWNPFESYGFKESNISFKSVYLSSLINIILFAYKPVVKDMYRFVKKLISSIRHPKNIIDTIHNMNVQDGHGVNINYAHNCRRCASLYKRPFVQWQETTGK